MSNSFVKTEATTDQHVAATIAWSAIETTVYCEPPFPDEAFCIQLVVLNGQRHIYRVDRETLTQLLDRISRVLGKSDSIAARIEAVIG